MVALYEAMPPLAAVLLASLGRVRFEAGSTLDPHAPDHERSCLHGHSTVFVTKVRHPSVALPGATTPPG